jgi:arginase family enzyme
VLEDAVHNSIPGFRAAEERNAVLVGVRDINRGEQERLDAGEVEVIEGGDGPGRLAVHDLERAIGTIADRVDGVYMHVDFDSIDPSLGSANEYAAEGGLGIDEVEAVASAVAERTRSSPSPSRRTTPKSIPAIAS